jgi:hypothetical protein
MRRLVNLRYIALGVAITLGGLAGAAAIVELNKPVPFCKIVDGREIDNHHCIPYCPPDPSECGD